MLVFRIAERRYDQLNRGLTLGRSQAVVLVLFGRVENEDRQWLHNAIYKMRERTPEMRLIIATRWAPVNEFVPYVVDPNQDIISLQQVNKRFHYQKFDTECHSCFRWTKKGEQSWMPEESLIELPDCLGILFFQNVTEKTTRNMTVNK